MSAFDTGARMTFIVEWDDSSADGAPEVVVGVASDLDAAVTAAMDSAARLGYARIRTETRELIALVTRFQNQVVLTQGYAWTVELEAAARRTAARQQLTIKIIQRRDSERQFAASSSGG